MSNFGFAFSLTLLAGLATGIGSVLAFITRKFDTRFLSVALGFSAGVMIFISFTELLPVAVSSLTHEFGKQGELMVFFIFFMAIGLTALIDMVVPGSENPHELHKDKIEMQEIKEIRHKPQKLFRLGVFTAAALALHNLPEGLATFVGALQMPSLAYPIALAIAIHNIPEGIAVSVPIYYATGSHKKAFAYSFLSGLAEPVGALIGYAVLMPFLDGALYMLVFPFVAGIMVYISFDELLPAAREYGQHHLSILGLFAGMLIMAFSLILL